MNTAATESEGREGLKGFLCALSAFLIWGLSPLYWKTLQGVPAFEIVLHRVVWSFLFLLPILVVQKRTGEFLSVMRNPGVLATLLATTLLVAVNWLIFIWSVNSGRLLQASLGYYINPLFSVLLGVVILKERLRRAQVLAVLLAAAGVLYLTIGLGQFPWIALTLAFTFGLYGLVRKIAPVSALVGLTVETLLMLPPSLGYLGTLYFDGRGAFFHISPGIDLLLVASALATALPLLLFNLGTRILHLSTIGFMQYIVPSCFFLFAVFVFREPISSVQLWTFALIWSAL
ncbi:MAG: EamA family transporter RarD, partial [Syntrophobacteraceae bacterium]|nr:EamA family transporter RarD [Syntrophobacteraceae bacterium]